MPGHILTICTANICRSPMAEALLQHALLGQSEPLKSLKVVSAGIVAHRGEPVSENSVVALKKVGVDLSGHRAQPLTRELVEDALAIFCMTESHRAAILMNFDPPPRHLYLFREFLPGNASREIADPFGGPIKVYEASRDEMVEAIPSIVSFLRGLVAEKKG
ncbi:protein-tyrosine-phosphatase [Ereboglobus sp. PH5-5]|uniref:low molecular weight protein arginine phosphatase n=1 Tax=unclassified Ereboglobus TaxID=2626932 RepID=UPI002405A22B|nr:MULTISPECIES: low molecular weight protein arginine phosphatase [unclassified Ereboglobus]MDF9828024.1 protein-tyrosine-phosphatase [Ereboglobus sp. PH5-10]MDF9832282.1 protein-tyrosine-phosphatase [Ereboglobus sp. PH5-5]